MMYSIEYQIVINNRLDTVRFRLMEIYREMELNVEDITARKIVDKYLGVETKPKIMLLDIFRDHNEKCLKLMGKDMSVSKMKKLYVFLETSTFRKDLAQSSKSVWLKLPILTNSSIEIIKYGKKILKAIYEQGYMFKITSIMVYLSLDTSLQLNLYDPLTVETRKNKMRL